MAAKWVGYLSDKNYSYGDPKEITGAKAQYYRKTFHLRKKVKSATLKISALGVFKAFINGQDVSGEYFAPGWTNFDKRILYRKYEVGNLLSSNNAISVCVGDGWYAGSLSIKGRRVYGGYPLAIFAELTVYYEDGTKSVIVTDDSWKAGLGAIGHNDFLYGEVFDSRLPHVQTSLVDFDDSNWTNVKYTEDKCALLDYIDYEPVVEKKYLEFELVSVNGAKRIYDCGQNYAGFVRVKCVGQSGERVIIRHGEMLNLDGSLYTANLRTAKATDTIILNGDLVEYSPCLTYHGFRYIEIECQGSSEVIDITGVALYNNLTRTGEIATSNQLFNQLNSNIEWGMRSNFVDLPTDCPQRNERLGWSGDTQVFSRTAMYIANCKKFYEKHMTCVIDDTIDGSVPSVVPFFGVSTYDATGWRDVSVVVPYNLLEIYGDTKTCAKYIPLIKSVLDLQIKTAENLLWTQATYNDWLNIDAQCDETVFATLHNIVMFEMAIKYLDILGEDSSIYREFTDKVRAEFAKQFIYDDGSIKQGTQTVYALAYAVNLIDKDTATKHLKIEFEKKNNHIHSGFLGIRYILPVLCDLGLTDLAYEMLCSTTYPSWGYSIVNGATTIWERWDSYTIKDGFQDPIMNSFNHYSLGSCGEWFYEYVLGIKPAEIGYKSAIIRPYVDRSGRVNSVSGSFISVNGKISVSWERVDGAFVCKIDKPKALTAKFIFENVTKIVQDGVERNDFDGNAATTTVYFN